MAYHRPSQLRDAFTILAKGKAQILAGATDIFPGTAESALSGSILDITKIQELTGLERTGDTWRIGANTTWSQIAQSDLPGAFHALQQAALQVGSPQIQNSATIAGNLCNASPAADGIPPLLVLNAEIEIASRLGIRRLPLEAFLTGPRQTALAPDELVTAILVPHSAAQGASAFRKLGARKYLVISICMVAVKVELAGDQISDIAISVGACSPVARRLRALEQALLGQSAAEPDAWAIDFEHHVGNDLTPITDIRSDGEYRSVAAAELCQGTIREAIRSAQNQSQNQRT